MVKAYLKYEPASCFGVIASPSAGVVALPSSSRATLVAAPAVDAVAIWNMRTGSLVTKLASKDTRRAGTVTALALASDGVTLAVGYSDGSLRIWSVDAAALLARNLGRQGDVEHADPEPMATFNGHRSAVGSLCFMLSPELPGMMEVGSSKTSRPNVVKRRRADVTEAYATAPTRLASGSNDGDIILWDMSAELGLFRVMAHNDAVTSVKLLDRESGPLIISASKDGLVRLYDALSQHCIQTIVGHHAEVWTLDLDPAHQFLFTGSVDAALRVFRLRADGGSRAEHSRSNPQHLDEGESSTQDGLDADALLSEIGSVQRTSAGGRIVDMSVCYIETQAYLATCATDKSAELFRIRSLSEAEQHRKRRGQRRADKAKKAATGEDPELGLTTEVMDSIIAKDVLLSLRAFKTPAKARSIVFPHGSSAQSSSLLGNLREIPVIIQLHSNALELNTVRVSVKSKKKRKKQQYRTGSGNISVAEKIFHANSEVVSPQDGDIGDEDKDVGAVERIAAVEQHGHRGDVRCIALSTDDKLLLSASRKSAKLWNVVTGECIRSIPTSGYSLSTCFLGANSQFAAVGSKHGSLEIVDLGSGEVIAASTEAHSDAIWSMTLDGELYDSTTLVTGGADKFVRFWDLTNVYSQLAQSRELKLIRTLELPDEVLCVRVAYQRQQPVIVVSLMDSTVRAFDLVSLDPYMTFYGHKMPVLGLDISSDGLMLATGSADKSIKLWGMDFGDCRRSLRAHADSVLCVAFQPGTHYLFSGSRDGTLKYWDCDKFEYVASLEGQRGEVWFISVSSDGELVASASRDRLMRIWRRTDEQLFLEEEQDRRMDEMFESTLLDEDTKEARKARSTAVGFMVDPTKGEALSAGKRSLETVKAGERLLDALHLGEAEMRRAREDPDDPPSPMLLGMTADAFVLRAIEQIKSAELEEALSLLPLDQANVFLGFCSRLLDASCSFRSRLAVEVLARASLFILRIHHNQIVAGAVDRQLVSKLKDSLHASLDDLRSRFGFNSSALSFWQAELAERHDATFRDASARAFNMHKAKEDRVKRLKH